MLAQTRHSSCVAAVRGEPLAEDCRVCGALSEQGRPYLVVYAKHANDVWRERLVARPGRVLCVARDDVWLLESLEQGRFSIMVQNIRARDTVRWLCDRGAGSDN